MDGRPPANTMGSVAPHHSGFAPWTRLAFPVAVAVADSRTRSHAETGFRPGRPAFASRHSCAGLWALVDRVAEVARPSRGRSTPRASAVGRSLVSGS